MREREGETFKRERERERERFALGSGPLSFYVGENPSHVKETRLFRKVFLSVLCTLFIFKIFFIVFYLFIFFENHIVLFINSTIF